jgi:hypothetical protein
MAMWVLPRAALVSLRVLEAIAGLLLIYAAAFLYEDEQGRIQNKLEEWWIRLGEEQVVALRRHTAFVREVAKSAGRGFESLFGEQLFSEQALVVSLYYSMASYAICVMVARSAPSLARSVPAPLLLFSDSALAGAGLIVALIALGTLPAFVEVLEAPRSAVKSVWANLAYFGMPLVFFSSLGMNRHDLREWLDLREWPWPNSLWHLRVLPSWKARFAWGLVLVVGGFACDIAFIAVTRWALRLSSRSMQLRRIAAVVVLNFLLAVLLVWGPLLLARRLSVGSGAIATGVHARASGLLTALGLSNSIDALAALIFFLLAITLVGHRVFWPMVSRPLYALQVLGITRRRKLFGAVGLGLLSLAGLKLPDLVKKVVEAFAG